MTSLLPPTAKRRPAAATSAVTGKADPAEAAGRPAALLAAGAGLFAAGSTLVVCMALGMVGWYLSDGGSHGAPHDGLQVGAVGWLMGHGSGVHVQGVPITAMPLGLTLVFAWTIWRLGSRVGGAVSAHGPDAEALADGVRDWTVLVATALFTAGYVVVAVAVVSVAGRTELALSLPRVVAWSLLLCVLVGGTAIAVGSGRAAVRVANLPISIRVAARVCRRIVLLWVALGLLAFVAALLLDVSTAANVMSQLHADAGAGTLIVGLSLLVVPNASVFAGSYLLGPGFAVGAGTLVSPSVVTLGPLPMFPVLAALPESGPTPAWTAALVALPPLVALVAAVWVLRAFPTTAWDDGAIRGGVGGVAAGVVFAALAHVSAGSVGPGRMQHVTPLISDVLVHGVASFGLGGVVGGLAITWWHRRSLPVVVTLDDHAGDQADDQAGDHADDHDDD